jgi:hypothetical protein
MLIGLYEIFYIEIGWTRAVSVDMERAWRKEHARRGPVCTAELDAFIKRSTISRRLYMHVEDRRADGLLLVDGRGAV